MKRKRLLSILLALCLTFSLTACGGGSASSSAPAAGGDAAESSDEPILIGTISPNTGNLAAYGTAVTTGVALAVEEINEIGRAHV